jgi:uncharacterized membrane protein YeaQ/YmgE (transglycosylase-associated protein family)
MELAINLGLGGWVLIAAGALIFGGAAQLIGEPRAGLEWLVDAIAFAIGAIVASEFITAFQDSGPMFDGLAVVPALVGGLVIGVIVDAVTRLVTGGTYTHGAASA